MRINSNKDSKVKQTRKKIEVNDLMAVRSQPSSLSKGFMSTFLPINGSKVDQKPLASKDGSQPLKTLPQTIYTG